MAVADWTYHIDKATLNRNRQYKLEWAVMVPAAIADHVRLVFRWTGKDSEVLEVTLERALDPEPRR